MGFQNDVVEYTSRLTRAEQKAVPPSADGRKSTVSADGRKNLASADGRKSIASRASDRGSEKSESRDSAFASSFKKINVSKTALTQRNTLVGRYYNRK